jgi:predicted DCC family thiol-disulfide oxidoreductase YuxK
VHTETTEIKGIRGWIFYDADCPICLRGRRVWGEIFDRRGFEWLPLQTPDVVGRLGLSEAALLEEMKVQLPDGQVLGGIDSWVVLFRSVWWLWPIGFILSLPGFHALGQRSYRWLARNRYCLGGKCSVRVKPRRRRTIPFLDLP